MDVRAWLWNSSEPLLDNTSGKENFSIGTVFNPCGETSQQTTHHEMEKKHTACPRECPERGTSALWGARLCLSAGEKKVQQRVRGTEQQTRPCKLTFTLEISISKDQVLGSRWQLGHWLLNKPQPRCREDTFRVVSQWQLDWRFLFQFKWMKEDEQQPKNLSFSPELCKQSLILGTSSMRDAAPDCRHLNVSVAT